MEVSPPSQGFLPSSLMMPETILLLSSFEPLRPAAPWGRSFSQQTLMSISYAWGESTMCSVLWELILLAGKERNNTARNNSCLLSTYYVPGTMLSILHYLHPVISSVAGIIIAPLYRGKNWGLERLRKFLKYQGLSLGCPGFPSVLYHVHHRVRLYSKTC